MSRVDPDALAALEEQRDFLLRSIADLEREHDAGDIDDDDYRALKDDYTARAASVLRSIDAGRASFATAGPRRSVSRRFAVGAGLVAFAVLAGVLVAQSSGRRDPGDTATGDVRETVGQQLAEAGSLLASGDRDEAIARYDEILELAPDNPEAATYRGWALYLDGRIEDGLLALIQAAKDHSDYPDVHVFLAVVFDRLGRPETALAELDRLDELDPPPDVRRLADGLRARLTADAATSTTSTTGG